jgi:hypothetical protein
MASVFYSLPQFYFQSIGMLEDIRASVEEENERTKP